MANTSLKLDVQRFRNITLNLYTTKEASTKTIELVTRSKRKTTGQTIFFYPLIYQARNVFENA